MPSVVLAQYIDSLQRCNLESLNANLPQFAFIESLSSRFEEEGVLVAENVFSSDEIDRVRSACKRLDDLARNEEVSYSDINLEAAGGGWKGQDGTTISHAGTIRKVMSLIDHGNDFRQLAFHPSLLYKVAIGIYIAGALHLASPTKARVTGPVKDRDDIGLSSGQVHRTRLTLNSILPYVTHASMR